MVKRVTCALRTTARAARIDNGPDASAIAENMEREISNRGRVALSVTNDPIFRRDRRGKKKVKCVKKGCHTGIIPSTEIKGM